MSTTEQFRKTQLAENMRFYGEMRFKQLTLFVGVMSLSAAGVAQYPINTLFGNVTIRTTLACFALLFTAVHWIMEVRSSLYFAAQRREAPELWPLPSEHPLNWLNATNALLVLYVIVYGFWLYCAAAWGIGWVLVALLALIGTGLLAFSIVAYSKYWARN